MNEEDSNINTTPNDEIENRENESDSGVETTIVTVPKDEGLRNELTARFRDTSISVKGWKACLLETAALGLMAAGAYFVVTSGPEAARSVGKSFFESFNRGE